MNRGCVGCSTGLHPSQNLTGDWTASRVYAQRLRMMDGSQSNLFETQTNGIFFSKNINLDTEPLTQTINFMTTTISGTYTAALRGQINSVTVATSNTAADVAVFRNQLIISSPATAAYVEISSLQVVAPLSSVDLFRPGVYRATWVTTNASSIGIAAFYIADTPSLGTHSSSDTFSGFRSSAITSGSIGKTANFEALGTTSGTISNAAYWINNNAATCGSGFVSGTNGDTCLYRGRSGAWTGGAGIDFYTDTGYICGGPTCSLVASTAQGVYDSGVRVMSSVSCTGASCSLSNGALSITVSGGGVTSLAGTTNQITASASTGAVTLSLPSAVTLPGSLQVTTFIQGTTYGCVGCSTTPAATTTGDWSATRLLANFISNRDATTLAFTATGSQTMTFNTAGGRFLQTIGGGNDGTAYMELTGASNKVLIATQGSATNRNIELRAAAAGTVALGNGNFGTMLTCGPTNTCSVTNLNANSITTTTTVNIGTAITGVGALPTFAYGLGSNCASSATGSLSGTNQMMYFSFTTGTGACGANSNIVVLTFGATAGVTTRWNCAVNAAQGYVPFWVDSTATTFSIRSSATALDPSTLYAFQIGPCSGY